jgi:NitT/TauT family transport system permease protein
MKNGLIDILDRYSAILLFIILVFGTEAGVRIFNLPEYIIPAPSRILFALYNGLHSEILSAEGYYIHTFITVSEAVVGFLIGSLMGVCLGALISQIKVLEKFFLPYLIALQATPKVALAPLLIVYLGTGIASKLVLVTILTFFPVLINSMTGFNTVDQNRILLLKSLGASRFQVFSKVKFPSALPEIFAGIQIAAVRSFIAAIVAEFVGAEMGLGVLILQMSLIQDTAGMFSILIILSFLGMLLWFSVRFIEQKVLFWQTTDRGASVGILGKR